MTASGETSSGQLTATVRLFLRSGTVEFRCRLPTGPCRVVDMLPQVHALTDLLVEDGLRVCRENLLAVSCHEGCGACCRVLVPVAEAEAHYLGGLIGRLSESRRAEVLQRFARARATLEEAGLWGALPDACRLDPSQLDALFAAYGRLQLACPFLEEESCSIYPDRPVVCREVLVVSPPEHCGGGKSLPVDRVELAARVSPALTRMGQGAQGLPRWVPLACAADWAAAHPDASPARPPAQFLAELLERLKQGPRQRPSAV